MMPLLILAAVALAVAAAATVLAVRDGDRCASSCQRPLHRKCVLCGGA